MLLPAFATTLIIQLTDLGGVPPPLLREAQAAAAIILADIGVTLEWASASEPALPGSNVIHLTMMPKEGGALRSHSGAVMGAAIRTAMGTRVAWVYYERILQEADRHVVPPARLLACAMAHEIGHLVQSSPAHDTNGLMRAVWTAADFRRASAGLLRFTPRGP